MASRAKRNSKSSRCTRGAKAMTMPAKQTAWRHPTTRRFLRQRARVPVGSSSGTTGVGARVRFDGWTALISEEFVVRLAA
jgi:hypothetical protein